MTCSLSAVRQMSSTIIHNRYRALVTLWLIDTTRQFMARDAHAIALDAFAHAHAPLPEFPALPPAALPLLSRCSTAALPLLYRCSTAALPLALPSMASTPVFPSPVVQWVSIPEALDDVAPVLTLYPAVVPMALSSFVPDDSVQRWPTSALPLVLAPWVTEALTVPVSPTVAPVVAEVFEAAPVVKKSRKPKATKVTAQKKTPRKRSPKTNDSDGSITAQRVPSFGCGGIPLGRH
jgi:hypothetical protein